MFNMMNSFSGPASSRGRMDALTAVQMCGMSNGLKLCVDAGDDASAPTSATTWLDTSGNGYDFFRGTTSGAQASDPTFNGTVGGRTSSEYFSGDGGDYFSYDTTIETWMQSMGKAGSVTVVSVARVASDTDTQFMSTRGSLGTARGFNFAYSATFNKIVYTIADNTDTLQSAGGAGLDISASLPMTAFFGFAFTISASGEYMSMVDNSQLSGTFTSTPTASNPTNNMKMLAYGDAAVISPTGSRLHLNIAWQGVRHNDEALRALFYTMRGRFSK